MYYTPKDFLHDAWRVLGMLACSLFIMYASPYVSGWLDKPDIATYGNWTSFLFAGVAAGHVIRKLLAPKVSFNESLVRALHGEVGAAIGALAQALIIAAIILASRPVSAAEIPPGARVYIPILLQAQRTYYPELETPSVLAAQVDKEDPRWSTHARLKTSREEGVGLGQITRTPHGFDALTEMVAAFPVALAGWSWEKPSLYDPVLQLRALVLKDWQNAQAITGAASQIDQLEMALYAYNAGPGNLRSDRMSCRATKSCNPGKWFGNVEKTCYRSSVAVKGYGNRSFKEISHEYVFDIVKVRRLKFLVATGEA